MYCEHFESEICHSCPLIRMPYDDQIDQKQSAVAHVLDPVLVHGPGTRWLAPALSPERGFRTSAKLVVGGTRRRPTLGILGAHRRGIDLPGCPIQHPAINAATPRLKRFIRMLDLTPYDVPTRNGELKNILITVGANDQLMIRFVLRSRDRVANIRRSLGALQDLVPGATVVTANIHPTHEALPEGPDEIILTKSRRIPLDFGDVRLAAGPQSFVQTNTTIARDLYRQVAQWASLPIDEGEHVDEGEYADATRKNTDGKNPAAHTAPPTADMTNEGSHGLSTSSTARTPEPRAPRSLWDLYCGVGGFAMHAASAQIPQVTGIEVSDQAIACAKTAAHAMGLSKDHVTFLSADATQWVRSRDVTAPDVIVVNPPRRGIGKELANWINASGVPRVIYSSCNPDSLVKDLTHLGNYTVEQARLFDMFPHTQHAEVAVLLKRRHESTL
ncbi:methyltransferase domain-containing protein [Schaalia sp. ZJ405]|uniref:methyltransferase domain-containing protein n=1 Tax=Schaalia sp. ZJ405 TaxID=2709403 RepID=UPI001E29C4B5|nr:methyltransferase domain-containing protein [Schaalia sp. ZJ405]